MRALTGHEVEPTLIVREAKVGDRYLLCSDGLSDPVSHETIQEALQIEDVAESADRLIELALRGGGPDNVTVVVADVVDHGYGQTQPILAGAVSGNDDQTAPPNTSAGRASAFNPKRAVPAKRPAVEPEPVKKPRSRRKMLIVALLLILLVGAGLFVGRMVIRSNYYVAEHDGAVYIMRGVQGSFLGMPLQQPFRIACLDNRNEIRIIAADDDRSDCQPLEVSDLRQSERAQVTAGLPAGSVDDAIRQLRDLGPSSLLPICAPPAPATTTTAPRPTAGGAPTTSPRGPLPGPAPETPTTVTSPAPPPGSPTPVPPASPAPTTPPKPSPTVTALPPPPQEPGTTCRAVS
jgi:protein phosphatase